MAVLKIYFCVTFSFIKPTGGQATFLLGILKVFEIIQKAMKNYLALSALFVLCPAVNKVKWSQGSLAIICQHQQAGREENSQR